jgi:hypothetical protein
MTSTNIGRAKDLCDRVVAVEHIGDTEMLTRALAGAVPVAEVVS